MVREALCILSRTTARGPRLLLRPIRLADGPAILDCLDSCRHRIRHSVPWSVHVRTLGDMRRRIRQMHGESRRREMKRCALVERAGGEVIGTVMLGLGSRKQGSATIGYWMRADRWGKGYGTEATILLARLAVERIGATRIELWIDPNNWRSRRIPERLGIPLVRRDNYWWKDAGKWVRSVIYTASERDVRRLKPRWNAKLMEYRARLSGDTVAGQ